MSATVELGKQLESLHYGAVELKQVINRNTYRAFRITAILLLLIFHTQLHVRLLKRGCSRLRIL